MVGTLNLKFMQRAMTSGGDPVPSLEKKKVTDEGEWDIGPEVRKAWGLTVSSDLKYVSIYCRLPLLSILTVVHGA